MLACGYTSFVVFNLSIASIDHNLHPKLCDRLFEYYMIMPATKQTAKWSQTFDFNSEARRDVAVLLLAGVGS